MPITLPNNGSAGGQGGDPPHRDHSVHGGGGVEGGAGGGGLAQDGGVHRDGGCRPQHHLADKV